MIPHRHNPKHEVATSFETFSPFEIAVNLKPMVQSKFYAVRCRLSFFQKLVLFVIVILLLGCGNGLSGQTVGKDEGRTTLRITTNPAAVSYGDEFTVSISGLPEGYALLSDSVTFAGFTLDIPGWLGNSGEKPRSDHNRLVTFTTKAHEATPSGIHSLVVNVADKWLGSTEISFRGANITISETSVVANQTITITGAKFTPSSSKHDTSFIGAHKITGVLPSGVFINGSLLQPPHVEYPIIIGDSGNFSIDITIPETTETQTSGRLSLHIIDSNERVATLPLNIANSAVVLSPLTGYPGDIIEARGSGISASNPNLGIVQSVDVVYQYKVQVGRTKSYFVPIHLGQVPVDTNGSFVMEFHVPSQASIPSANRIVFTPSRGTEVNVAHNIPAPRITVKPTQVYNSDDITVTITGLPRDYRLPPGSLSIASNTLGMPGYFEQKGVAPISDSYGTVSYVTSIPMETPDGRQTLRFVQQGKPSLSTTVTVLNHSLASTPKIAALGESVEISSSDFGRSKQNESSKSRSSIISGNDHSYISLDGVKLREPYVRYPIRIDQSGQLSFEILLPVVGTISSARSAKIELIDSLGRQGTARITYTRPQISVSPTRSNKGSKVGIDGTGFPAREISSKVSYDADVYYAGNLITTKRIDPSGSFKAEFIVPQEAKLNTTHQITVRLRTLDIEINAQHSIPDRHISIQPRSASSGSELIVTGAGFPSFSQVKVHIDGSWVVPPPVLFTNEYGSFTTSFPIPNRVRLGERDVLVKVQDVYTSTHVAIVQ